MGYNTQILILNDGLSAIENNPEEFTSGIIQAIKMGYPRDGRDEFSVGVGNHANCVSVIPTAHADITRVLVSNGNWMWEIPGKYGLAQKTMERAKTEKFIRNELIARCKAARNAATETLVELLKMEEEDK